MKQSVWSRLKPGQLGALLLSMLIPLAGKGIDNVALGTWPTACTGDLTATMAYSYSGVADQYSIDYSTPANESGFADVVHAPLTGNPLIIDLPPGVDTGHFEALITFRNSESGEESEPVAFVVAVLACEPPYLLWVPLAEGEVNGNAVSITGCDPESGNVICYGLEYTPGLTGNVTSYTTGFVMNCAGGMNPFVSQKSAYMSGGASVDDYCGALGAIVVFASANTGSFAVQANTPVIIHQICLSIPLLDTLVVSMLPGYGDVSLDLAGGGFSNESLDFSTYRASWEQECLTMPLTWLDFRVSRRDVSTALLEWKTTEEYNNDYFDIQHTTDLSQPFVTIGQVAAAGDAGPEAVLRYSFVDAAPAQGVNYYRLRQVDHDGRDDYSPIRSLHLDKGSSFVEVLPNPVATQLNVKVRQSNGVGHLSVFDPFGRQVWYHATEGNNLDQPIDVSQWPSGLYVVVFSDDTSRHTEKIVVKH